MYGNFDFFLLFCTLYAWQMYFLHTSEKVLNCDVTGHFIIAFIYSYNEKSVFFNVQMWWAARVNEVGYEISYSC